MTDADLFLDYAVRWRTGDARPGKHVASQAGVGGNFRGIVPFWQLPDARRIDVRRSITDPFGMTMVRQTDHRGSIAIVVAADLTASMQAAPGGSALDMVAEIALAASRSALRAGDAFGFVGFDETVREAFCLRPTRARGAAPDIAHRLRTAALTGRHAAGIAELARHLPTRRCLLLLISDFLLPLPLLEAALAELCRHDVAPVVLHGAAEQAVPRAGLLRLRDAESGQVRLVLMRPALHRRWQRARAEWQTALDRLLLRYCRPAFHVKDVVDMAALGAHLVG